MLKRIFTALALCLAAITTTTLVAPAAHADVLATYGHFNSWYDIHGNKLNGSSGAAVRVGVEMRGIGTNFISALDTNVCVQPLSSSIVRTSVDTVFISEDGGTQGSSNPNHIVNAPSTNCADLDPNVNVVFSTATHAWFGAGFIAFRRTDGVLVQENPASLFVSLNWDS